MGEAPVSGYVVQTACSAHSGIPGGEDQAAYPGKQDRARAHRTGLERHVQGAIREPFFLPDAQGLLNGQQFGVCGGVTAGFDLVVRLGQNPISRDQHSAHGHLTPLPGAFGQLERAPHEMSIPLKGAQHRRATIDPAVPDPRCPR